MGARCNLLDLSGLVHAIIHKGTNTPHVPTWRVYYHHGRPVGAIPLEQGTIIRI
jgi:hypothetical protein